MAEREVRPNKFIAGDVQVRSSSWFVKTGWERLELKGRSS